MKCSELIPNFKKLPGTLKNCQFGILDITYDRRFIEMVKNTILDIDYVPYMFICYNGLPIMEYKGDNNIYNIRNFIIEVDKQINSQIRNKMRQKSNKIVDSPVEYETNQRSFQDNRTKKNIKNIIKNDNNNNGLEGKPLYGDMSKGEYMDYISAYGE